MIKIVTSPGLMYDDTITIIIVIIILLLLVTTKIKCISDSPVVTTKIKCIRGNSLAVQWLGLCASAAGGTGLIPGRGTKIPHAVQHGQKKKKK